MNLISLFMMGILTENIVLTKFLGMCPFIGTTNKEKNAIGMGISVTIVVTISSILTYGFYHWVLIPMELTYLKTITFILIVSCMVTIFEFLLKKFFLKLHRALGIYLPLITTNCAVLGVLLLGISNDYSLLETLVYSFSSALGFTMVSYVFASIRENLARRKVPNSFQGYPIALVTASIMAILFSRYIGL